MATAAETSLSQWSLPSIDNPAPPLPPRTAPARSSADKSGSSRRQNRSGKSGMSRRRAERSAGTSDNRWTASEIAAYFGFDPNQTPSTNSASSVFPSSRYGESYTSKCSRTTSCKSFMGDNRDEDFRGRLDSIGSDLGSKSAWNTMHYHFQPDYEEKKKRLLKGKFRKELTEYFPDLTSKRNVLPEDSEDDAYDTDLDPELGQELLADERAQMSKEFGNYPEYKRLCRKYQVVPNSYFLRHITDEELRLNFRYLSFGDAYTLAKEIENQPSISYLDLEDNAIGPAGMLCFADMLTRNSYIHRVNLSDNRLGVIGARLLKSVLLKNARLVVVNISGNQFGERGAKYLADVIDKNDIIRHLYMSHNAIGDNGATLIGKALGNNITLRTLDLSWNHIRKKGAFGFSKGLKQNCTLETLNLAMNGLHLEGTRFLMASLKGNEGLRELDLSANRIDKEAAKVVARTVPHMLQLTTLRLAFNPLTSEGAEQLVKAFMNCPFSPIECLDLEGVTLEDYFQLLAEELLQQRGDGDFKLLYRIPPSSRERSMDMPLETLTQLADLLDEEGVEVSELFQGVPEDDQLILSTEDLFIRVHKSGRLQDPQRLSRLKRSCHRDMRRRFLLKDLLLLSTRRRHSQLEALKTAHALDTPELQEAQTAWRYPRPHSSSASPFDDSEPYSPEFDWGAY